MSFTLGHNQKPSQVTQPSGKFRKYSNPQKDMGFLRGFTGDVWGFRGINLGFHQQTWGFHGTLTKKLRGLNDRKVSYPYFSVGISQIRHLFGQKKVLRLRIPRIRT